MMKTAMMKNVFFVANLTKMIKVVNNGFAAFPAKDGPMNFAQTLGQGVGKPMFVIFVQNTRILK